MIYRTSLIPSAISISRQLKSKDLIALLVINDFPLHLQGVNVLSLRLLLYALIILINSDEMCVSVYKRLFEMELFSVKTDSLAFSVECFSPHFQITTRDQISYRQKFNFLHCLKGFLLQSCQFMDIPPFQETTISSLLNRLRDIFVAIKIFLEYTIVISIIVSAF